MDEKDEIKTCFDGKHQWKDLVETETIGPNIFGKIVTCKGWDMACERCVATSWRRNNGTE